MAATGAGAHRVRQPHQRIDRLHLVMVSTIALAVFGVLMVQSSASVEAIARGQDGFTVA